MAALDHRDRPLGKRSGREILTESMHRVGPAPVTDRQLEIARRWYPGGQLEAERVRIRERSSPGGYVEERPGCLVAWLQSMAGAAYVIAVPALGWWLAGPWGAVVGFVLVTAQMARHW
jgi:hypothetical protein